MEEKGTFEPMSEGQKVVCLGEAQMRYAARNEREGVLIATSAVEVSSKAEGRSCDTQTLGDNEGGVVLNGVVITSALRRVIEGQPLNPLTPFFFRPLSFRE